MNRVWIELERPKNEEEGQHRANLLSDMLKKLGTPEFPKPVFWNTKTSRYCFTIDSAGSFMEAEDDGFWFNLDILAKL